MRDGFDIQAVTDRMLGVLPPRQRGRTGRPKRSDKILAAAMLATSAVAVLGSLGLWAAGHGAAGLRLFCGAVLVLAILLRLR